MKNIINPVMKELSQIYDTLREKYLYVIDANKEADSVGGSYYGSTQLFSTRGTHFEKTIGYDHQPGYYGIPRYYDFVFKVGGRHRSDFFKVENQFKSEFEEKLKGVLNKYGFEGNELILGDEAIQIHYHPIVTSGTNFSVYFGLRILIKQEGNKEFFQINTNYLRKII